MKKIVLITTYAFGLMFLLGSCSTTSMNHTMDDGKTMSGATHEESSMHKKDDSDAMNNNATNEATHTMNNGEKMEGKTHEETQNNKPPTKAIQKIGTSEGKTQKMHTMDDGKTMSGATHEENNTHTEGNSHEMDDGSSMDGATHEMDDGTESQ